MTLGCSGHDSVRAFSLARSRRYLQASLLAVAPVTVVLWAVLRRYPSSLARYPSSSWQARQHDRRVAVPKPRQLPLACRACVLSPGATAGAERGKPAGPWDGAADPKSCFRLPDGRIAGPGPAISGVPGRGGAVERYAWPVGVLSSIVCLPPAMVSGTDLRSDTNSGPAAGGESVSDGVSVRAFQPGVSLVWLQASQSPAPLAAGGLAAVVPGDDVVQVPDGGVAVGGAAGVVAGLDEAAQSGGEEPGAGVHARRVPRCRGAV